MVSFAAYQALVENGVGYMEVGYKTQAGLIDPEKVGLAIL